VQQWQVILFFVGNTSHPEQYFTGRIAFPPREGIATKANPAKAGDAKLRG
jgi:hypothetical protein